MQALTFCPFLNGIILVMSWETMRSASSMIYQLIEHYYFSLAMHIVILSRSEESSLQG